MKRHVALVGVLLLAACQDEEVVPTPIAAQAATLAAAPTLHAVQSGLALGQGEWKDLSPFVRGTDGQVPAGLTWSSGDAEILAVDPVSGRASARQAGRVAVTATAPGRDPVPVRLDVEVLAAPAIASVTVEPAARTTLVGDGVRLRALVRLPGGGTSTDVHWKSSDPEVVSIDPKTGEAHALKPGRAILIAAYGPDPRFVGLAELIVVADPRDLPATATATPALPANGADATPEPITALPLGLPPGTAPSPSPSPLVPTPTPTRFASPSPSPTPTPGPPVTTLAGGDKAGLTEGSGLSARFNSVLGVVVDAGGTLYVADNFNNRVRRIAPNGEVSTLAGGKAGYADGTGAAALFNGPSGLALDRAGDLVVADQGNHRLRRVTLAGVVTTLAGSGATGFTDGPAPGATFDTLGGVATDGAGAIYACDYGNHAIRKITADGVVSTFAGQRAKGRVDATGTAASFAGPYGLAIDRTGMLYVGDSGNHAIRVVRPDGRVSTLAGGVYGHGDGPGVTAKFRYPFGVAVDARGIAFVADWENHRIRTVTPQGVVADLAGSGQAAFADGTASSFRYPTGIALDATGNVYVADTGNHRIRKVIIR